MISQLYSQIVLKINVCVHMHTQTHTQICRKKANDKTNEAKVKQLVILGKKKKYSQVPCIIFECLL